ncbi:hypothetical protein WDU94_008094 [Cyamophila willieti]
MLLIYFVCIILNNMSNTSQEELKMEALHSEKSNSEMGKANQVKSNPDAVKAFDAGVRNAYKSIVNCTKAAQSFPSSHENSLLIASPAYITGVASTSEKVMGLVDKLLRTQNISKSMSNLYLEGQKDVLIDANDKLLESINTRIDVMAGVKTPSALLPSTPKVVKESWNKRLRSSNVWQEKSVSRRRSRTWWFMMTRKASAMLERPQLKFKDKIDNSHETIFEPKLKDKPNALKPLAILLEKYETMESFSHPYEYELDLYAPHENFLSCDTPQEPLSLEDTPLVIITEPNQVNELLTDLKHQKEIGIDLEYHHYRSFQGYTCLMQISTREKDYIVDTLKLREDLQVLNEIFTDKNIVKLFHGADMDIKWLQKDFGLYVVGMFDTHQACKFLSMPRQSLAYLLKHYCSVDCDKTFQLFDWRNRPLPKQALEYARSDTHYLLYIYDRMKQDLIDAARGKQNLVLSTFNNSRNVCKFKYEKPVFNPEGYIGIFRGHSLLNNQQMYALRELYKWRDKTARERDESIGYVLPNHMLLHIAQSIPRDVQGIFACCNPVPLLVRELVLEIHAIILRARLQPLTKPVEKTKKKVFANKKQQVEPPHDSMDSLNYKGLPPVFPDREFGAKTIKLQPGTKLAVLTRSSNNTNTTNIKAVIKLFFEDGKKVGSSKLQKVKLKTARFETPYQRFLKSKEYAKAVQEKLDKENAEQKRQVNVKKEPEEIPKVNVKQEQEPVVLKQIKTEEKVEMAKEKRKKILQEREEGGEEQQEPPPPVAKKIKTEKSEDNLGRSKKEINKSVVGKGKEIISEPKDNNDNGKDNSGRTKSTIPTVDYSKVNFNKYMAKPNNNNNNSGLNQNGKRPKGGKGGGKPNKKKR